MDGGARSSRSVFLHVEASLCSSMSLWGHNNSPLTGLGEQGPESQFLCCHLLNSRYLRALPALQQAQGRAVLSEALLPCLGPVQTRVTLGQRE